jgi:hypothetical protein
MRVREKKVPEFFSTAVRKVEPVGGGVVRVYYALERNGDWDDQFTVLMPMATIATSSSFVNQSAREIAAESLLLSGATSH